MKCFTDDESNDYDTNNSQSNLINCQKSEIMHIPNT